MKELNLYPLSGLLMELQTAGLQDISAENRLVLEGKHSLKRANSLFWAKHLAMPQLESLMDLVKDRYRYSPCYIPRFQAILDNPNLFLSQVKKALAGLSCPVVSEQKFFSAMKCMTVLCNLYSDFIYKPFRLTIDQGFLLDVTDTRVLVKDYLSPVTNPYFNFIKEHCRPIIEAMSPDLIWIYGQPTFSSYAMAMFARKAFSDVHICLVDYPSEYYSLNKIKSFLKTNKLLFSIIDSILLHNDIETQKSIVHALENSDPLNTVPNLIYIGRNEDKIKSPPTNLSAKNDVTVMFPSFESLFPNDELRKNEYNSAVAALKMWPQNACYWNKCTFCGINQKYHTGFVRERFENIDQIVNFVAKLTNEGYRFFWMIDEAVPPDVLKVFAYKLIERKIIVNWGVRSRIDKDFSRQVCDSLAKAGLREIRFGLESASYRILKLMNKFPDDFHLSLVEKIVKRFHELGVSVHLCIILDFPGETHNDRMETFDFLRDLKNKYHSVTFNLNRFMLDITSKMFVRYENFDITRIEWPCPSKYFLGNMVEWNSENRHYHKNNIDDIRNNFMRRNLYPWMPLYPMTPPFNFYMQNEAFKMTLLWKTKMFSKQIKEKIVMSMETRAVKSDNIVYSKLKKRGVDNLYFYQVYNWDSHIYFDCDERLTKLYDIFIQARTIQEGLELFFNKYLNSFMSQEQVFGKYYPELEKAFNLKIVRLENSNV